MAVFCCMPKKDILEAMSGSTQASTIDKHSKLKPKTETLSDIKTSVQIGIWESCCVYTQAQVGHSRHLIAQHNTIRDCHSSTEVYRIYVLHYCKHSIGPYCHLLRIIRAHSYTCNISPLTLLLFSQSQ